MIATSNLENNLGLLNRKLNVHCSDTKCEKQDVLDLSVKEAIMLGNNQAIIMDVDNKFRIIGV